MQEILICPTCKSNIKKITSVCYCEHCGMKHIYNDDYYDFCDDNNEYWGEIPCEEMEHTVVKAKEIGWKDLCFPEQDTVNPRIPS